VGHNCNSSINSSMVKLLTHNPASLLNACIVRCLSALFFSSTGKCHCIAVYYN
jgi:hypothetical protein